MVLIRPSHQTFHSLTETMVPLSMFREQPELRTACGQYYPHKLFDHLDPNSKPTAEAMAAANLFQEIPYLGVYPLETAFPYLTPDTPLQASRNIGIACARVRILGSLKANRLQGHYNQTAEACAAIEQLSHVKAIISKSKGDTAKSLDEANNKPSTTTSPEEYLAHLLTNYTTQKILLSYLDVFDLISLRSTSRQLRNNLDRERSIWRNLNLSHPRSSSTSKHTQFFIPCKGPIPTHLYRIIHNHEPASPISPYHHLRVLILDNFNYKVSCTTHNLFFDILSTLLWNDCVRKNLKLFSMRGTPGLGIKEVANFLRDWQFKTRGEMMNTFGWKYLVENDGSFRVVDKNGEAVEKVVWKEKLGLALEVLRFASPNLFTINNPFISHQLHRKIPTKVPSYLHIPSETPTAIPNGQPAEPPKFYSEVFASIPINRQDTINAGPLTRTIESAQRLGFETDVGFCKNMDGHLKMINAGKMESVRGTGPGPDRWYWGLCERRWESCVMKGCKWKSWTEACGSCRWEEGWCCRGCFGWVCEDCREKCANKGIGVWCTLESGKCGEVESKIDLEVESDS
ncbi:hypothetical protein ABW19_dt0201599 [Dactylella cylindrospora]|nr:hypothetical protein ABW19_dt0201599 [Dactylella cylindrospora]